MFIILQLGARLVYAQRRFCAAMVAITCITIIVAACATSQGIEATSTTTKPTNAPTKTSLPEEWPLRWLQGIPCRPPCWEGVTPGLTPVTKAVEIWRNNPLISTTRIVTSGLPHDDENDVVWTWATEGSFQGGQASFRNETSDQTITLITPYYPTDFKLGDVIHAFGEPSEIAATASHNPEKGFTYAIRLVYRSQGFVLSDGWTSKPSLNAELSFSKVVFFAPTDEGLATALPGIADRTGWLVPWQGFKKFDYYCRDDGIDRACQADP